MKLIFGVCSAGGQCEEVMRALSELKDKVSSGASDMLLRHRYVDDFMKSVSSALEAEVLAQETEEAL